jgi:hypothetical protein
MVMPVFLINNVSAADGETALDVSSGPYRNGKWWRIKTDFITILFPADGKKPMFLWWYSNDTNNIYVVKYKGLIEYVTIDYPYYLRKYEANPLALRERLEAKYCESPLYPSLKKQQIRDMIWSMYLRWILDLHPAYLPFNACQWNLTGPVDITREDGVSYISFNFTLVKSYFPIFKFAESNVIIRCRFYKTGAIENAHDLYNYTVHAGELKMDLVVKNWEWNIDRLTDFFNDLQEVFNITVPKVRAGLALWIDLASIEIVDMPIAEQDANSASDLVEANSKASDIIVGDYRVPVHENKTAMGADETPIPLRDRICERCRLRFARRSQTLAGFFDFVNTAVVINATGDVAPVNVTAAYIPAGNHMRLFIGYPYFGNYTLEHDPSIGVESVTPWLPTNLLLLLIGITIIIGVAVAVVKIRKKTVNIVNVQ